MRTAIGALLILGLAAFTAGPIRAQGKSAERLGTVRFATSCAPAAQAGFDRAVALLHSFWLDAAVEAPSRRWRPPTLLRDGLLGRGDGVAGQPAGGPPNARGMKEGAARSRRPRRPARRPSASGTTSRPSRSSTRTRTVDHRTRAVAYEQAMEQLAARYPDDREAAIFYASRST